MNWRRHLRYHFCVSFLKWPILTTWEKDKEAGDVVHVYIGIHQVALCLLSLPSYQAHIHDITPGHSPHPYSLSWSPSDWPLGDHFHSFRLTHSFFFFLHHLLLVLCFYHFHSVKNIDNLKYKESNKERKTREERREQFFLLMTIVFRSLFSNNKWYQSSKKTNNNNRHYRMRIFISNKDEEKNHANNNHITVVVTYFSFYWTFIRKVSVCIVQIYRIEEEEQEKKRRTREKRKSERERQREKEEEKKERSIHITSQIHTMIMLNARCWPKRWPLIK